MGRMDQARFNKYFLFIFVFLIVLAGLFALNILILDQPAAASANVNIISQAVLEEKYGLRVNLLAVTAAGGMVDLRLKILDGEKVRLLLQDKKNFPALLAGDKKIPLSVDEDTKSQEIQFENNSGLYLMFPNSGNVVKPGSNVTVAFGDIQLEPVSAK